MDEDNFCSKDIAWEVMDNLTCGSFNGDEHYGAIVGIEACFVAMNVGVWMGEWAARYDVKGAGTWSCGGVDNVRCPCCDSDLHCCHCDGCYR